ncbi:DUF3347 domain-containing protein [Rapidithrix thailandica]|uniref:DUF3347 domain-containing protein n=1 Tax=Rapidithrix thailandica TaxID=413964 RepID=A0AAW9SGF6_9BACT
MKRMNLSLLQWICAMSIALFALSGCGSKEQGGEHAHHGHDHGHEHEHTATDTKPEETTTEVTAENQTDKILSAYYALKNALVATDANEAKTAAGKLAEVSEGEVKTTAEAIANNDDVEVQRASFQELTQKVYDLVKASSDNSNEVYKQFCPMAFDNTGAFWLSAEEEIKNPYFGDKMLKCGKVDETIAKN